MLTNLTIVKIQKMEITRLYCSNKYIKRTKCPSIITNETSIIEKYVKHVIYEQCQKYLYKALSHNDGFLKPDITIFSRSMK